jgi:hypothetical protein
VYGSAMRSPRARLRPLASGRGLIALAAAAAVWCAAALAGGASPAAAATLLAPAWTVSASATGATSVSYTFTFTAATTASISSVTMTVPSTTAGSPGVGTVSPLIAAGAAATLAGATLTYRFTAVTITAGTFLTIQLTGLTNPTTAGSPTSTVTASNGDSGVTGAVTFTAVGLTSAGWSASSTAVGAAAVTYTFTFTTSAALLGILTGATMTVPPGTSGTPVLVSASPGGLLGGTVTLSGNTLTYSGLSLVLLGAVSGSIVVSGLTNTATAGSYTAEIVTQGVVDSGITPALNFTGPLTLTAPSSLGWAATLTGTSQAVVDPSPPGQQFTVNDETATGPTTAAGWHITVAATTFTSTTGARTLPDAGTLVLNGSRTSVTATAGPSVACVLSCTPPGNTTTYPAAITTAASGPTPATVFDAPVKSGLGPVLIGGATPASPVGWWVNIPAAALAGSYISTVTVAVISGP